MTTPDDTHRVSAPDFSRFAQMYERWLVGPLFRPWAEILLDTVALAPGEGLLDVACGTGIVARLAKRRLGAGGRVVGVDANAAMLSVARAAAPDIDWRDGDAASLPLHDEECFDVVTCQQGLQFFPDKSAATRRMWQALVPGGRIAVATWRPDEEVPLRHALLAVAQQRLGPVVDARHAYGNDAQLAALLRDAGFDDVRVTIESRTTRFEDPAMYARMNANALVGMSEAAARMDTEERNRAAQEIADQSAPVLEPYVSEGHLVFEVRANLAVGRRPATMRDASHSGFGEGG